MRPQKQVTIWFAMDVQNKWEHMEMSTFADHALRIYLNFWSTLMKVCALFEGNAGSMSNLVNEKCPIVEILCCIVS